MQSVVASLSFVFALCILRPGRNCAIGHFPNESQQTNSVTAAAASMETEKNKSEAIPLAGIEDKQPTALIGHSYDDALKESGFGRAQIWMTLLCGFSVMASANESMGMGIILPASQCDLELDLSRKGVVSGAVFMGIMVSTYYWGYQTDVRGRKAVLKVTLLAAAACSFVATFVNQFEVLVVLRFIVGLFISAPASAAIVYLGEFCPSTKRGQMIGYACALGGMGFGYVAVFGWWILSYKWTIEVTEFFTIRPWRMLFLVNTLPGFVSGLVFCLFPETPKFLLSQGRTGEALKALRWLHKQNKGYRERFAVQKLQCDVKRPVAMEAEPEQKSSILRNLWTQISPLTKFPHSLYLVACSIQTATAYITYGGLGVWFPQIMNIVFKSEVTTGAQICSIIQINPPVNASSSNITSPIDVSECNDTLQQEVFIYTLLSGLMCGGYMLLSSIILSKLTEKTMIYVNMITAGCAGIALQYITHSYVVAALFCVQIVAAAMCIVLVRSIQVAAFPTQVRATAISLTNLAGRVGLIISNVVTGLLIVQQCTFTLYTIATLLFVSAGLNALLP
ncbi:AAEL015283-PA [Aedes aegypti]|uniref:AAEL015283-PA n=1 Tax=Aedes aegypti TaxID=7159 RepID=Q1DH26_AEDAE|nr:AAEL015283-PA [Aedes aegypti]